MTAMVQRIAPRFSARPWLSGSAAVMFAVAGAYWWAHFGVPGHIHGLWGSYFATPMGWLAAAGVALVCYRRMQLVAAAEHEVERSTVLMVGALVGCFLVALQFLVGLVGGFGRSPYAHSPLWLGINLLFAGSMLLATETARAALLRALGRKSLTLALVFTALALAAIQFTFAQFHASGLTSQMQFWGGSFIPAAATGLLVGFFVLYGGIPAGLLVAAPLVIFQFYSPILPNVQWPIMALAGVGGAAVGLWIAEGLFAAGEGPEEVQGRFHSPSIAWLITAVFGLAIFWFSFGFFGFRPSFVPSHSMEPHINQGDVVLVGPVQANDVRVGDVVLYQLPNQQRVLHRVIAIQRDQSGNRIFVFKGDNNNAPDPAPVADNQLMGKYIGRVPKIGWVAIEFNAFLRHVI